LFDRLQSGDLARHLLLVGCALVEAAHHVLLTSSNPIDALPHRVEVERYCVELPIRRTRGFSSQDYVESALGNWFSLRRQPAKLQPCRHSGCRSLGVLVGGKWKWR